MASQKALAVLSKQMEALTGYSIDEKALDIWYQVLIDLTDDQLYQAMLEFWKTEQRSFRIMPGAIYQTALSLLQKQHLSPGEAWLKVRQALKDVDDGRDWAKLKRLPQIVQRAAEQVGWWEIINGENLTADRARFLEFYQILLVQEEQLALAASKAKELK